MKNFLSLFLLLFSLVSCKGTRFYWESNFTLSGLSDEDKKILKKKFHLKGEMSTWHPIFGKYCSTLKSNTANLFVCFKNDEMKVVSSYPRILKGNQPIRTDLATVEKYLTSVHKLPGYIEHREIEEYVITHLKVKTKSVRLLEYASGSVTLKDELSKDEE